MLDYLVVFCVGGLVCLLGQILIIRTRMTSSRILVLFLMIGIFLEAVGLFEPLAEFAKAGITVPILGFGSSLAKGAIKGLKELGVLGVLKGGLMATAAGISAAVGFAYLFALIFKSRSKTS